MHSVYLYIHSSAARTAGGQEPGVDRSAPHALGGCLTHLSLRAVHDLGNLILNNFMQHCTLASEH